MPLQGLLGAAIRAEARLDAIAESGGNAVPKFLAFRPRRSV